MVKKCNNSDLLIRIDERVKVLHNDIPVIKQDIKEMKARQDTIREEQVVHREKLRTLNKKASRSVGNLFMSLIDLLLRR